MSYGIQRQSPSVSRSQVSLLHASVAGQAVGIAVGQRVLLDTAAFAQPSVGSALALGPGGDVGAIELQPGSLYELSGWLTTVDFDTTGRVDVQWAHAGAPFTAIGTRAGRDRAPDVVRSGPALAYFDARAAIAPTLLELRFVTVSAAVDSVDAVALVREL